MEIQILFFELLLSSENKALLLIPPRVILNFLLYLLASWEKVVLSKEGLIRASLSPWSGVRRTLPKVLCCVAVPSSGDMLYDLERRLATYLKFLFSSF